MHDPAVILFFGGSQRRGWSIDRASLRYEIVTDKQWFRKFAAVTFQRVMDDWLAPTLGLSAPPQEATGVEVVFVTSVGVELCSVSLRKGGSFVFEPTNKDLFAAAARNVERIVGSGFLRIDIRLSDARDDSWGSELRTALAENIAWNERRTRKAADAISPTALSRWVLKQRSFDDIDTLAMSSSLAENVRDFLARWPNDFKKDDMRPWKTFVTEVFGRDFDVLVAFCPRRLILGGERVVSSGLDLLLPPDCLHVKRLLASVDDACEALRRPRFSPKLMFSSVELSRVFCSPESVLMVKSGNAAAPHDFYIEEVEKGKVARYLREKDYDIVKHPSRRIRMMGAITETERWVVDRCVSLCFVEKHALKNFDHTLEVGGVVYGCQKNGVVATHSIARLMLLIQEGRKEEAETLKQIVHVFHTNTGLGFPVIDGRRRKKRLIYFSDYDQPFHYKADDTVSVPDQFVPLNYTKHMHEKHAIDIWETKA